MNKLSGLTLLSLLLSLSITSILITMAIPGLGNYFAKSESRSASALIRKNLGIARNLAVSTKTEVTVCGINLSGNCSKENVEALTIFFDANKNQVLDHGERIFRETRLAYSGNILLRASWRKHYIQFTSKGSSRQAGSFIYCDPKYVKHASRITVSMSGRSYIGRDLDKDGRVELTNGEPISC